MGVVRTNPRSSTPVISRRSRPRAENSMGVASCGATSNGTAVRGAIATGGLWLPRRPGGRLDRRLELDDRVIVKTQVFPVSRGAQDHDPRSPWSFVVEPRV